MEDSYKPILGTLEEMVRERGLKLELCTVNGELEFPDASTLMYVVEGAGRELYITQSLELRFDEESAILDQIRRHNGIYPLEELLSPARRALVTSLWITLTDVLSGKILTYLDIQPNGSFTTDTVELYTKSTYQEVFGALLDALTRNSAQNNHNNH